MKDRLNAPELIEYWSQKNISYKPYTDRLTPYSVFKRKQANCVEAVPFVNHLLRSAGYTCGKICVDANGFHVVSYYKDKGMLYMIDVGRPWPADGIFGPYKHKKEIPYKIISLSDM